MKTNKYSKIEIIAGVALLSLTVFFSIKANSPGAKTKFYYDPPFTIIMTPHTEGGRWMFWTAEIFCGANFEEEITHGNSNPDTVLFYTKEAIKNLKNEK